MSAAVQVQTVTEFARNPAKALKKVEKGDLILRRTKGKPSIRLTLASRAEASAAGLDTVSRALGEIIRELRPTAGALGAGLAHVYPWVGFLPPAAREKFSREFVEKLLACASISNFAPMGEVVDAWKATAEIYADPALAARLREPASAVSARKPVARP
jgi:hypothetical protein